MPTIICINGYRLFFVSFDGSEPMHVHVRKGDCHAKAWVEPLRIAWSDFKPRENRIILRLIRENVNLIRQKWYDHFKA